MTAPRGFCVPHKTPLPERIQYYIAVDLATRCWEWLGARNPAGYGLLCFQKKLDYAHRYSYVAFKGSIPDRFQIDHLCRNRGCVNPDHLEAVTPSVNVRRSMAPGAVALRRTHCAKGHAFAEHGVMRSGRRLCRICIADYQRAYQARRRQERAAYWAARGIGSTAKDTAAA